MGSAADASTIAAAVWDRLSSALTTTGSIGKYLYDNLATMLAKTNLIGTGLVSFAGAVANGNLADLYLQDDYFLVDGREIYIPYNGPALASVALYIGRKGAPSLLTIAGVVTAGTQT